MNTIAPHLATATFIAARHLTRLPSAAGTLGARATGAVILTAVVIVGGFLAAISSAARGMAAVLAELVRLAAAIASALILISIAILATVVLLIHH